MDILPWIGPVDLSQQIGLVHLFLQIGLVHLFLQIDLVHLFLQIDQIDPFLCPGARASHEIVRDWDLASSPLPPGLLQMLVLSL